MTFVTAPCGTSWQPSLGASGSTVKPIGASAAALTGVFGPHAGTTQPWVHAAGMPTAAGHNRRYVIRPRGTPPV